MKEFISYNDPADPRYGTTDEIDHPDPPDQLPPPVDPIAALTAQLTALSDKIDALNAGVAAISPEVAQAMTADAVKS